MEIPRLLALLAASTKSETHTSALQSSYIFVTRHITSKPHHKLDRQIPSRNYFPKLDATRDKGAKLLNGQQEVSHSINPVFAALPKHLFLRVLPVYSACCGGPCQPLASPTAFPSKFLCFIRQDNLLPLLTQDSRSRRGILRRAVFSEDQRKALEKMFQKQKYISKTDRKKLALNLGLKESQVQKTLAEHKVRGQYS
ncbi:hypothetical protein lerEdw1_009011 [Lerista edwardsae]|nr:hypothetical protein lerEdw1_009011 [Lerista edwardsae]